MSRKVLYGTHLKQNDSIICKKQTSQGLHHAALGTMNTVHGIVKCESQIDQIDTFSGRMSIDTYYDAHAIDSIHERCGSRAV